MSQGRNRPSPFILFMRKLVDNDQLALTLVAVVIGACVGGLAILFIETIDFFQTLFWEVSGPNIADHIRVLPIWQVLLIPTMGALSVGLLLFHFMGDRKPKGPADVIAACEVGAGKMSTKDAFLAFLCSALSIGSGGSVGREGPVVHMGASFASLVAEKLQMARSNVRILLGCGVAAAVSASFNAPIAGALFAQEVILSHYALKAFAPVVIASVVGTVVAHQIVGNETAFTLQAYEIASYMEFPAFIGLGLVCGLVAIFFVWSILNIQEHLHRLPGPFWYKPAIGGFCVGMIALYYPEVLGVGYEATAHALKGEYLFSMLAALFVFKLVATVLSLGFSSAGGVFSPSLVIGAMLGGSYGLLAGRLFPALSSGAGAYALIGMASMAAAVLGAPISTTLIVFELTGDYAMTIAVMCGCVFATMVNDQLGRQSFFLEQLKIRGIDLRDSFSSLILNQVSVASVLKQAGVYVNVDAPLDVVRRKLLNAGGGMVYVISHDRTLYGAISWQDLPEDAFENHLNTLVIAADIADTRPPVLQTTDSLEVARSVFEEAQVMQVPVVDPRHERAYVGCIDEREVIHAYNEELVKKRRQEEGH